MQRRRSSNGYSNRYASAHLVAGLLPGTSIFQLPLAPVHKAYLGWNIMFSFLPTIFHALWARLRRLGPWLIRLFCRYIGTPYSPPSPPDTSSSATMSPVYPDRPIRPLPRRSIRARLSPEVADQIPFPVAPQVSNAVFNHYKDAMAQRNGANITNAIQEVDKVLANKHRDIELDGQDGYRFKGNPVDSDEEEQISMVRRLEEYQLQQGMIQVPGRGNINGIHRATDPMSRSVASSNDSVDGYDSFENTNNKKKRKIPTSGSIGSHHASLSASLSNDMANMGISGSRDPVSSPDGSGEGAGQYYGTGSSAIPVTGSGTGISGAGRGRYGRSARRDFNVRNPLVDSSGNRSNAWHAGRLSGSRRDYSGGGTLSKGMHVEFLLLS